MGHLKSSVDVLRHLIPQIVTNRQDWDRTILDLMKKLRNWLFS